MLVKDSSIKGQLFLGKCLLVQQTDIFETSLLFSRYPLQYILQTNKNSSKFFVLFILSKLRKMKIQGTSIRENN